MPEQWPDVLIIDDDEELLGTVRNVLEDEGYSVVVARDGNTGLRMMETALPRLVICDVRMPGLNGYEVLAHVRRRFEGETYISFIFLSAVGDGEFVTAGYEIGADDYLTKPFDNDLLVLKVKAILRQREKLVASGNAERAADRFQADLLTALSVGSANSGSIRLLSLEEMRRIFGDEWESLERKALAITEGIIRRSLGPKDVYTKYGDDGFLVLFHGADETTAERRTAALADEIRLHLLGERHAAYRQLSLETKTIDLARLVDEQGRLDLDELANLMASAGAEVTAAETSHKNPGWLKEQLSIGYRPVWNASRQAVIAFQCIPIRTTPYGQLFDRDVLHGGPSDPWAIEVDHFLTEGLAKYFDEDSPDSDVAAHFLPLHFTALTGDQCDRLDETLSTYTPTLAQNRLIIQIIALPEFRGASNIQKVIQWARGYSRHVSIEFPADDRHAGLARSAGATILQLPMLADTSPATNKAREQLMEQSRQLKRLRMQGLLGGIDLLQQFTLAKDAGIQMLTGNAIGPLAEFPRPPYKLSASEIVG